MHNLFLSSVPPVSIPSVAITEDMLQPLVDGIMANINVVLPFGIIIFGLMLGVRMIPKVAKMFIN